LFAPSPNNIINKSLSVRFSVIAAAATTDWTTTPRVTVSCDCRTFCVCLGYRYYYYYYYYYSIHENILVCLSVISSNDHRLYRHVDGHKVRSWIFISQHDMRYALTTRQHESDRSVDVIYPSAYGLGDRRYYCETVIIIIIISWYYTKSI